MEKSERQKKRNDSCNKDNDDGSRKAEQRPKDDFSGHETADEGSKLTSTSEPKNDPKQEKVQDNKLETTDAKQDKSRVKLEHKAKEKVKRGQEAKEEHKEREKLKKQQKQEKIEKERENKDIKEEEKAKETNTDEEKKEIEKVEIEKSTGTYKEKEPKPKTEERERKREEVRKEEKVEDTEENRKDEKEKEQEKERKELRDDVPPTVKCMLDDDRNDIIEKHPILVRLLSSESSPSKNPERSASVSACTSSPRSGIPKPIPLTGARRSVSPPPLKNVYREISSPPKVRRPDSPPFPAERDVCVPSPRKNAPEDPLPKVPIPDSASLTDTCIPCRFGLKRNIVVAGAISRARQSRNDCPGSRGRDNKVDPDFDQRDRPPPSERPGPRNASKSPSPKKPKDQPPSPKGPAKDHPSPKKET